jgi:hypothetical protein
MKTGSQELPIFLRKSSPIIFKMGGENETGRDFSHATRIIIKLAGSRKNNGTHNS